MDIKVLVKKVLISLGSLLLLLLVAGSVFYFTSYRQMSKKYKAYVESVKITLAENEELNKRVNELTENIFTLQIEKEKLLEDLSEQEVKIIYKEKIVYKDGELVIPADYEELKENYLVLSEIYEQKSSMYTSLKEQSEKDTNTINELLTTVSDLQIENQKMVDLLKDGLTIPIPFFQQAIAAGLGFRTDGTSQFDVGYQAIVMDKYTGQIILEYPFAVKFLIGIKL